MTFDEIAILLKLVVGALGTFCAILLWSRSRDTSWILVVIGVLVSYAGIIFDTLDRFGLIALEEFELGNLPTLSLIQAVLSNLPMLLYAIAFVLVLRRSRVRK
jgi:hypothetical protein